MPQTPSAAVVLPYTKTFGQDAIDLYNSTGRIAQQWQELLLYDILARNEEDLWVHTKFGYAVPRRNGKNEIAAIRELYGLQQGESILHTAHRTTTSRAAWERLSTSSWKIARAASSSAPAPPRAAWARALTCWSSTRPRSTPTIRPVP